MSSVPGLSPLLNTQGPRGKARWPMPRVMLLAGGTTVLLAGLTYGVLKSSQPVAPVRYVTKTIRQGNLALTYSATGEVQPATSQSFTLPNNASLSSLNVTVGQTVKQGQTLAVFSDPNLRTQLATAEVALIKAQTTLTQAEEPAASAAASAAIQQAQDNLVAAQDALTNDEAALAALTIKANASGPVQIAVSAGQTVNANQVVATQGSVNYLSPVSGTVNKVDVASGQMVSASTTLLQLSDPSLTAKVASDESAVAQTQVALDNAEVNDGSQALNATIAQDQAIVRSDQASVKALTQEVQALTPTAPFAGEVIVAQSPTTGNQPAVTLVPTSRQVTVSIPESEISYIHIGQAASIALPAYPSKRYTGQISSIDPVGSYSNGVSTFNVTTTVKGLGSIPYYGMSANVVLTLKQVNNQLLVPLAAIRSHQGHTIVRVVQSGKATLVPVTIVLESDTTAAVSSPRLKPGEQVVIAMPSVSNGKLNLRTKGRPVRRVKSKRAFGKGGKS